MTLRREQREALEVVKADAERERQRRMPRPLRLTEEDLRAIESVDMGPLWQSLTAEVRASWAERDALRQRLS